MISQDLLAELGADFALEERSLFIQEIAAVARDYQGALGSGEPEGTGKTPANLRRAIAELERELGEETIRFAPALTPIQLSKKQFELQKLPLPPYLAQLMQKFQFYLVNIPVTLFPKPGWGFVELECIVALNPGRASPQRPLAYQIFPKEEWQTVLQASQELEIGLDENLEFKTPDLSLANLSGLAGSQVGLQAGGKARLLVGPFRYRVRRSKIITRGLGDSQIRWRLQGAEYFEQASPQLGVVLQVPKAVETVDMVGVLKASKNFHAFTAEVRHLMQYLRERTRRFFEAGAPIVVSQAWENVIGSNPNEV